MLTSIFTSFDAFCAEALGHKIGVSLSTTNEDVQQKQGQLASTKIEGVKKAEQINNSSRESKKLEDSHQRKSRFAPEFDGLHCFETIIRS